MSTRGIQGARNSIPEPDGSAGTVGGSRGGAPAPLADGHLDVVPARVGRAPAVPEQHVAQGGGSFSLKLNLVSQRASTIDTQVRSLERYLTKYCEGRAEFVAGDFLAAVSQEATKRGYHPAAVARFLIETSDREIVFSSKPPAPTKIFRQPQSSRDLIMATANDLIAGYREALSATPEFRNYILDRWYEYLAESREVEPERFQWIARNYCHFAQAALRSGDASAFERLFRLNFTEPGPRQAQLKELLLSYLEGAERLAGLGSAESGDLERVVALEEAARSGGRIENDALVQSVAVNLEGLLGQIRDHYSKPHARPLRSIIDSGDFLHGQDMEVVARRVLDLFDQLKPPGGVPAIEAVVYRKADSFYLLRRGGAPEKVQDATTEAIRSVARDLPMSKVFFIFHDDLGARTEFAEPQTFTEALMRLRGLADRQKSPDFRVEPRG